MQEMNVKELADRIKAGNAPLIIDVREPNGMRMREFRARC